MSEREVQMRRESESSRIFTDNISITDIENLNKPLSAVESEQILSKRFREEVRNKHAHLSVLQKPSIAIICGLLLLLSLSEMLYTTPMISLMLNKICIGLQEAGKNVNNSDGTCDMSEVQKTLSFISSISMILNSLISLIISGKIGPISDRIGRVKVFAYMGVVKVIGISLSAFSLSSYVGVNIYFILLSGCIPAFSGGMFAVIANTNSYISDITEPEERAVSMSTVMSVVYASSGLAPLLSSFLIKTHDGNDMVSIYTSVLCAFLFTILCLYLMREPRHPEAMELSKNSYRERQDILSRSHVSRLSGSQSTLNKIKHYVHYQLVQLWEFFSPIRDIWLPRTSSGSLIPRFNVLMIITIDMLVTIANVAIMPALILFTTFAYGWKSVEIGYFISFSGICNAIFLSLGSQFILKGLKKKYQELPHSIDQIGISTIRIGTVSNILGLLVLLISLSSYKSIILYNVIKSVGAITGPTLQATVVKYYGTDTGKVFGAIALLHSIIMLFFPAILLRVYGSTVSYKPEAFLYIPFSACILAFIVTYFFRIVYIDESNLKDTVVQSSTEETLQD